MTKAVSCGGIVIYRGKILLLYKNFYNKNDGWVLPKGTVEENEEHEATALREVYEEGGVRANIVEYIGYTEYRFTVQNEEIDKEVHWYLMNTDSYYSRPQREEFFEDSGFYKFHEAYHLLKFDNEKEMLKKAFDKYIKLQKEKQWPGDDGRYSARNNKRNDRR